MTYGINCAPAHADYLCSWPNEIRMWLQLIRPRWNLQLLIQGYGGVHAGQFATDPRLIPADIYVVDTLVNRSVASHPTVICSNPVFVFLFVRHHSPASIG